MFVDNYKFKLTLSIPTAVLWVGNRESHSNSRDNCNKKLLIN